MSTDTDDLATPAAVQAFLDLAIADLDAHGAGGTYAQVGKRIGVSAPILSQARLGVRPISIERLIRWVRLWNARPGLGGIGDYRSPREIAVEATTEGIRVYERERAP